MSVLFPVITPALSLVPSTQSVLNKCLLTKWTSNHKALHDLLPAYLSSSSCHCPHRTFGSRKTASPAPSKCPLGLCVFAPVVPFACLSNGKFPSTGQVAAQWPPPLWSCPWFLQADVLSPSSKFPLHFVNTSVEALYCIVLYICLHVCFYF